MSLPERSKRRVETHLDRLAGDYGSFERVENTWRLSSEGYERTVERFEAGTVGGAGVWVSNDDGEVLLVRDADDHGWSEPAGKVEPGESLETAARREVVEETGVESTIDDLLLAQVAETRDADDPDRPPVYRLIVVFAGTYVSGEVAPADGEIAAARWWDRRPQRLRYPELATLPIPVTND